jgi:type II secretory pathway component PulM
MTGRSLVRALGPGMLALAVVVHLGLTRPATRRLDRGLDEHARLRRERAAVEVQVREAERAERARKEALGAFAALAGPGEALPRARRAALDLIEGSGLRRVQLSVRPAALGWPVAIQLRAAGPFRDARPWLDRLVAPGCGLVLDRIALRAAGAELSLDLAASRLEAAGR